MIYIGPMIASLDDIKEKHKKAFKKSKLFNIDKKLENLSHRTRSNNYRLVYSFLLNNLDDILIGDSDKIRSIVRRYTRLLNKLNFNVAQLNYLNIRIKNVFNYKNFSSRQTKSKLWSGYELAKSLNIPVCPYCNRIYTTTIDEATGKTRPQFDHFYPQHIYPYLALSLFNLIPSCSVCNSSLKNTRDFTLGTFINPFFEGFEQIQEFTLDLTKKPTSTQVKKYVAEFYSGTSPNFKISFKDLAGAPVQSIRKAKRNIAVFKLRNLYNTHKDYVLELLQKSITYNKTRRAELWKNFGNKIFFNKNDMHKMIFGNYITSDDLGKRPLAKLTKDIAKELGLPV